MQLLVRAFQVRGHHIASLDPLGIAQADLDDAVPPELKLDYYGWDESHMSKEFDITNILPRFAGTVPNNMMSLGQIVDELKTMYCECAKSLDRAAHFPLARFVVPWGSLRCCSTELWRRPGAVSSLMKYIITRTESSSQVLISESSTSTSPTAVNVIGLGSESSYQDNGITQLRRNE